MKYTIISNHHFHLIQKTFLINKITPPGVILLMTYHYLFS